MNALVKKTPGQKLIKETMGHLVWLESWTMIFVSGELKGRLVPAVNG